MEKRSSCIYTCYIQETHLNIKNRHQPRVNGWKKILEANGPKKQAEVAILISDKMDFKPKLIIKDRKGIIHSSKVYERTWQFLTSMRVCKRNITTA